MVLHVLCALWVGLHYPYDALYDGHQHDGNDGELWKIDDIKDGMVSVL